MSSAGSAAAARTAIAAGVLFLTMSGGGGCSRPPLPQQDGVDAAPEAPAPLPVFMAVAPCLQESNYLAGPKVVTFGFLSAEAGFAYDPKCLEVHAGEAVTFSGDFVGHPLYPSQKRGTIEGNPIAGVSTGDSKSITFPEAGLFGYYCGAHGAADDGSAMAGLVWVR
jgi:plastocyanin